MLNQIIFYSLDKAIRRYRKLAQANIDRAGIGITVDQWLVLQVIEEDATLTQTEIADRVFKDQASVARILALLGQRGLLAAEPGPDGRRQRLTVTAEGRSVLAAVQPVILQNRRLALDGLTDGDLDHLRTCLERIAANCAAARSA